jgi:threonine dehydrogenase-like Zn-dependent dehydrogenase
MPSPMQWCRGSSRSPIHGLGDLAVCNCARICEAASWYFADEFGGGVGKREVSGIVAGAAGERRRGVPVGLRVMLREVTRCGAACQAGEARAFAAAIDKGLSSRSR